VDRHKKGLTDKQKRQWAKVANSARARCIEKGGTGKKCDASAIRQANSVVGKSKEATMPDDEAKIVDGKDSPLLVAELMRTIERLMEMVAGSLGDQEDRVRTAFRKAFGRRNEQGFLDGPYVRDVFEGHPDLGDSVVVNDDGILYQVDYEEGEDGFTFDDRPNWVQVELFYRKREVGEAESAETEDNEAEAADDTTEAADVELAESATGSILELVEGEAEAETSPARQPLSLDIAIIQPGFGNAKDNRYYGKDMLKRDAHVFEGTKMYATDHRPEEKSVRTEVAKIKNIVGFTDDGAPIARAVIFDPGFAEATRNRAKAGELGSLECSILATGRVKPGKVDGKKANVVEAITRAISVDFVTKAGAGGKALNIAESVEGVGGSNVNKPEKQEQEQQAQEQESEQQPQEEQEVKTPAAALDKTEVSKILSESKLPTRSQERLTETEYADEAAVEEAVQKEVDYIKELTGSGRVVAQGATSPKADERISEADFQKRLDAVDRRHGLHVEEA